MKALMIITMLLLVVGLVSATPMHEFESGKEFGQHVSMHAKDPGFSGDHNPGVHHKGYSPWARAK